MEDRMFFMATSFPFGKKMCSCCGGIEGLEHEQWLFPVNKVLPEPCVKKQKSQNLKIKLALHWLSLPHVPASL